jgi:endonuclease/exonuclease/phosphatase family metal-dependent hydrolase
LEHRLRPHFEALARFPTTRAMEASGLYAKLRAEVECVLDGLVVEQHGATVTRARADRSVRVTAWNIERGKSFENICRALTEHDVIGASDVLLLTELDYGMARTSNRFVAREIAARTGMSFAFAPCYIALNKGSGLEAGVEGENTHALHGNALLSRFPLSNAHSLALPNGKDKMKGKEKRLGSQRAVIADVAHPSGEFRAVTLHLDAHSTQRHRLRQMRVVLDHLERLRPRLPVVVGGDWNTSTYNSKRAAYSIAGYFRRVAMGVRHVIRHHYPHPERWFERGLFRELERRGYDYRSLNELGAGTLHYDVEDLATYENLREWVPAWCFWFIRWALQQTEGRCSLKLDWFTGRGIRASPAAPPRVVSRLEQTFGPLSDHDPIVLDFHL